MLSFQFRQLFFIYGHLRIYRGFRISVRYFFSLNHGFEDKRITKLLVARWSRYLSIAYLDIYLFIYLFISLFILKEAEKVGLGPWLAPEHGGKFRGTYRAKSCARKVFVIVYCWEMVQEKSSVSETILTVPLEWISTDWLFVAFPNDEFYYPGDKRAVTSNPKYNVLVDDCFEEFPISKFAKRFGCKLKKIVFNC